MNIQAQKLELMKLILESNNSSILESIKHLFKLDSKSDFWETLSKDEQNDILKGIQEVENGETIDYNAFMSKYR